CRHPENQDVPGLNRLEFTLSPMNTDAHSAPPSASAMCDLSSEATECLQRAETAFTAGNLPLARKALRSLVVLSPNVACFLISLGNVEFLLGEMAAAEQSFEQAASLDADNAELLTFL